MVAETVLSLPDETARPSSSPAADLATADALCSPVGSTGREGVRRRCAAPSSFDSLPPTTESGDRVGHDPLSQCVAVPAGGDGQAYCDALSRTAASPGSSDHGSDRLWTAGDRRTSSIGAEDRDAGGVQWRDDARVALAAPASLHLTDEQDGRASRDARSTTAVPLSDLGPGLTPVVARSSDVGSESVEGEGVVLSTRGDRSSTADFDLLHATLGHYSRELLDIQKLRVAQGNRVAAMERDGLPEEFVAFARDTLDTLTKKERALNAYLGKQAARHPLGAWVKEQRGIGLPGFARLVGITGPLDRFATVSKLWAYLGLHTVDGVAPKKRRGEKANWSHQGRVLCHQIGESIVKVGKGGEYREAYDRKKADYAEKRPEWTPAHRHAAALRYAVKHLLKRMWLAYRKYQREEADDAA